jgi:hypothetical protein
MYNVNVAHNTVEVLAIGRRWVGMDLIISLYISIVGGIIAYYICQYFDGDE